MLLVPPKILADRACPTYQTADTAPVASSSSSSSSPSSQPSGSPPVSPLPTPNSLPPSPTYASTPSSYVSFSPNEPEFTTPPLSPATPTTTPLTTTTTTTTTTIRPPRPTLKRMPSLQRLREAFIDHDAPASPPPPPPSLASSYYPSCRSSSPSSSEPPSAWVPLPLHFKRRNRLPSTDSSSVQARISRADPRTAVRGRVKSVNNVVQGGYGGADGLWSVSDDGSGDEDEEGEGDENGGDEGLVAGVKRILGALTKRWWQRNEEEGEGEEEDDEVVEECCIHSGAEARVDRFQELHCRGCLRRERGYRL